MQVDTPDQSLNVLDQRLAPIRLSRAAYGAMWILQPGGAFGFRDQLQDVMALLYAEPRLVREHLLRWRPVSSGREMCNTGASPSGRGVRTHCSDDTSGCRSRRCRYVLYHR